MSQLKMKYSSTSISSNFASFGNIFTIAHENLNDEKIHMINARKFYKLKIIVLNN